MCERLQARFIAVQATLVAINIHRQAHPAFVAVGYYGGVGKNAKKFSYPPINTEQHREF